MKRARRWISNSVVGSNPNPSTVVNNRRTNLIKLAKGMKPQQDLVNNFMMFNSRSSVFDEIMEAVLNPSINRIRVYGDAGVGKTMLVQQIKRKVEQLKLFDDVVVAKVTKNPDLKRIQEEFARDLGLELPDRVTPWGAADLIKSRLTNRKVLVILDEIWAEIDLENVGIPYGNKQKLNQPIEKNNGKMSSVEEQTECTVLLTSRRLPDGRIHTQKEVEVRPLEDGEAWELFWKIAGFEKTEIEVYEKMKGARAKVENQFFLIIAEEISKKCGGLPIAIATLANTLKSKSPQKWRSTLLHLQSYPTPRNPCSADSESLGSAIKLRYSDLESKELQQTLLLCSLMGHNAGIQDLLKYGVGLGLFPKAICIEEARGEALKLVEELRRSPSLLLEGGSNMHFDMHDSIREVAISIASGDHDVLVLRKDEVKNNCSERKAVKNCKWIYLSNVGAAGHLPDELKCPQLSFFYYEYPRAIPDNLFRGTEGLRVLGLTKVHFGSKPLSISLLINLHTLCLDQSEFAKDLDIGSIIGELKNLQVLSLARSNIERLPMQVEKLIRLKLLDLSHCTNLKVIPPDVLSKLSQLEELYLGNSFDQWDIQEPERTASLEELKQLGNLTALEVRIHDIMMIPTGLFSTELKRHKIFIGDVWNYWDSSLENSKTLKLKLRDGSKPLDYSVGKLIKKTEELHLEELNGIENVVNELDDTGFQELKHFYVKNDAKIQHMFINSVRRIRSKVFPSLEVLFLHNLIKLEKIFDSQFEETSFKRLRTITVEQCKLLKNLFSFSVAKQLLHLQEIRVIDCSNIVEIVDDEVKEDDEEREVANDISEASGVIELAAQLQYLRLQLLPEFVSFNHEKLVVPEQKESHLSQMRVLLPKSDRKWNLTRLIIEGCDKLEILFCVSIVKCLEKLEYLIIRECDNIREIMVTEKDAQEKVDSISGEAAEEKVNTISFTSLKFLQIEDLQKLTGFCSGNYSIEFPSLKQLAIEKCPMLKGLMVDTDPVLFTDKVKFPSLERLSIYQLKKLKIIWHKLAEDSFAKLNFLHIEDLQNLSGLCSETSGTALSNLKQLTIVNCPELTKLVENSMSEALFEEKIAFPKLERLSISHLNNFKVLWKNLAENTFSELKSLRVAYCQNLSSIFPYEKVMLRELLKSLKKLEIIGCNSVEKLFELGQLETESNVETDSGLTNSLESVTVFDCPKLNHLFPVYLANGLSELRRLEMQSCPELENIVAMESGSALEFASLSCLILHSLPKLRFNQETGMTYYSWPALEKFYSYRCDQVQITNEQLGTGMPKLKKLSLTVGHLRIICRDRNFTLLRNIEVLRIHQGNNDESLVFPIDFIQQFRILNKLSMESCDFKSLFPPNSIYRQSSIRRSKLNNLPNLMYIWSEDSSLPQDLETLKVWNCRGLNSLCFSTPTASFQTLTTLDVWSCQEMINLVSFSAVQILEKVKSLSVRECHKLTEIVGNDGPAGEINFKELRYLRLECLTKLTSFCSGNFTFKFPSLERVIVNGCTKLNIFSQRASETPILQRVQLSERKDMWHWAGDLNATIKKLYEQQAPRYHGLETLNLAEFPELKGKWNTMNPREFSKFRQLTSLQVCEVSELTYLLTPSMAMELVELEKLEVKSCQMMERIINGGAEVEEDELTFDKLKVITLVSCSKLSSFFAGSYTLKFTSLEYVDIVECPNMVIFPSTFSRDQEQAAPEPFFSTKVEFSYWLSLKLSSVNFQQMSSSVQNLTELDVKDCGNLEYLMSFSIVQSFSQLKRLMISSCMKMKGVIEAEGIAEENQISQSLFPKLESLELEDLQELTSFSSESRALSATTFVFPQVTTLKFSKLPKLESFFPRNATKWPSLTTMQVCECGQVHTFVSEKGTDGDNQHKSQTLFWVNKVEFSNLESLRLSWVNIQQMSSVQNLKTLVVEGFGNLKYLMPFTTAQSFLQLKMLVIRSCKRMKEVLREGIADGDTICCPLFPKLNSIELGDLRDLQTFCFESKALSPTTFVFPQVTNLKFSKLPKLKNFFPGHATGWPSLTSMQMHECDQVETFASEFPSFQGTHGDNQLESQTQGPLFLVNKQLCLCNEGSNLEPVSNNLTTLEVQEGSSRSNTIDRAALSFSNLRTLNVSRCHGLRTLYTIPKRLDQLPTTSITDGSNLEHRGDEVTDEIVFTQLTSLQLSHLSSLETFCSGRCNFKFPSLEEVIVSECPKMSIFSHGEVKTEKLQKVKMTEEDDVGIWKNNLNETIQEEYNKKRRDGLRRKTVSVITKMINGIFWFICLNLILLWEAIKWIVSAPLPRKIGIIGALLCILFFYILR